MSGSVVDTSGMSTRLPFITTDFAVSARPAQVRSALRALAEETCGLLTREPGGYHLLASGTDGGLPYSMSASWFLVGEVHLSRGAGNGTMVNFHGRAFNFDTFVGVVREHPLVVLHPRPFARMTARLGVRGSAQSEFG